jgi:hypothetical protein
MVGFEQLAPIYTLRFPRNLHNLYILILSRTFAPPMENDGIPPMECFLGSPSKNECFHKHTENSLGPQHHMPMLHNRLQIDSTVHK